MIKYGYLLVILIYVGVVLAFIVRFEISYRIVKTRPEIVETRDLTYEERRALERAEQIRNIISSITLVTSVVVVIISGTLLYFKAFDPLILVKVFLGISLLLGLILFLVKGIHFIPQPPIR